MAIPIRELPGPPRLKSQLQQRGVTNSDQLLNIAGTSAKRRALAQDVRVEAKVIERMVSQADLARVHGVGPVYADLLEQAGVHTLKKLAAYESEQLHIVLVRIATHNPTVRIPNVDVVKGWITYAQSQLPGKPTTGPEKEKKKEKPKKRRKTPVKTDEPVETEPDEEEEGEE